MWHSWWGYAEMPHPDSEVVPNVAKCLNPTFYFWVQHSWWGYAEMTHPNPKSCSKWCKMPKSNLIFLDALPMAGGMLKWPTLTLKVVSNVAKCLNPTFYFWAWCSWWWGMLKCPTPTLKVVANVTKCLNPTFHFWVQHSWLGVCWNAPPNPKPKSCSKCHKLPKSNFSFLGVKCLVGDMLKIPHPQLKIQIFKCPYEIEIHKFPFQA